ncbi:50S ribosomal protein L3 [Planoprotostelium fungivorum]|uniref:Large ribosomal subunit protein uL3m n=1 Tax=Planoprotostelium fungivorum TaxID=1890364 RepID=A0A2P6NNF2_9EUKA|nr:50S ribosomal protein L3 [Planoprotostelium fungivorum]
MSSPFLRCSIITPTTDLTLRKTSLRGKGLVRQSGKLILIPKTPGKASLPFPIKDEKTGWTLNSVRCGAIGQKAGMTMEWDNFGVLRPLTLIRVENCHVTKVFNKEQHGVDAVQLGATEAKIKHLSPAQIGQFAASGIAPKRELQQFKITPDAVMPVGTEITVQHFVVGQKVSVTGMSKGKGFAGPMKRWGFSGGAASHGNTLNHRTHGSTGARQEPGKVWKGKKMAGHMGHERVQAINLKVFEIYPQLNTMAVIGCVPGPNGAYVRVIDSLSNVFSEPPPFPTHHEKEGDKAQWIQYQFKNPWYKLPDLQEHFWKAAATDQPEKLFNGQWTTEHATLMSDEVKKSIRDKISERERNAVKAKLEARLRGETTKKKKK